MNSKTIKLLQRWSRATGKEVEELKTWWKGLNNKEREIERKKILKVLDKGHLRALY